MSRPWALRAAAISALALTAQACAVGKTPPEDTPLVPVTTGLTFQFGMGIDGCGIPEQSTTTCAGAQFDPGWPEVLVTLQPFAIDAHEVTNEQYDYCVALGECSLPAGDNTEGIENYYPNERYAKHPVVLVSWLQAQEYCAFRGKRLPTEAEWERVAGGPAQTSADKRVYPWADPGPTSLAQNECSQRDVNIYGCKLLAQPVAVMSASDDVVIEGGQPIHDLAGNVKEWTLTGADETALRLGCDSDQPYDCDACLTCLDGAGPEACKAECLACQCGEGSAALKPNCYAPCDTPICPRYMAADQPIALSVPANVVSAQRMIRGGSFSADLEGALAANPCQARSDDRRFSRAPDEKFMALGFRCAQSL